MANTKKEHYFEVLRKHNVSEHMEKKGQFNYLSWAYAVEELRKLKPDATWRVIKDENGFLMVDLPVLMDQDDLIAKLVLEGGVARLVQRGGSGNS